ncbi:MAG: metallophosphoesterase [Candidatus Moranbacteria bacterium]|nr:metallophosphoesterase [Candidatus Moranbacteria bacterium]
MIKKIMLFAFVFMILLLLFLTAHGAAYFSLVRFFDVTSLLSKNILLGSLIFLGASFFASTLISHLRDNAFSRGYYLISGSWLGFLINLLLFFALVWICTLFTHTVSREKTLAIAAVIAAIIYSLYGVWNAFNPKVVSIDVAIDALPQQWVGKKIVQISDVHLGHVYRAGFLIDVVNKINMLNPEVVVITGDLFDGTDGNLDSFLAPLNKINAPVYFVVGNHETYLGLDKVMTAIAKTKIIPLKDDLRNVDGLQFVGINYPLRGSDRDIAKIVPAMPNWDQFAPSILLMHEPLQVAAAKKLGISLQLSGHTHRGQLFPFGLITSLIFDGYDHGFKREGSFAIYTSSGLGGWGPPMRTENRSEIVEIKLR